MTQTIRNQEKLILLDLFPVESLQKGMTLDGLDSKSPKPFFRICVEHLLQEVLALRTDHVSLRANLGPVNSPSKYVIKDSLDSLVSKGSDPHNHLIGNNSQGEPVHGLSSGLSTKDLRGNIIRRAIKRIRFLQLFLLDKLTQVKICQDQNSLPINHNIILNGKISTGFRSL